MRNATLVLAVRKAEDDITDVLLAMKKRGFGVNRWNGVGGKVLEGESIIEAALREAKEEIGVDFKLLNKVAELSFTFPHNESWNQMVHVYTGIEWDGEPVESEEMRPKWFLKEEIPYDDMWPDDIFWLPKVLEGKFIKGAFTFGEGDKIAEQSLVLVDKFD